MGRTVKSKRAKLKIVLKRPGVHTYASGARRSIKVKARYDLVPPLALRRLALRYGLGASAYGEFNWQKGMPLSDTLNHVIAHLENFKQRVQDVQDAHRGDESAVLTALHLDDLQSDDDLAAAMWGCAALMWLIKNKKLTPDQNWSA